MKLRRIAIQGTGVGGREADGRPAAGWSQHRATVSPEVRAALPQLPPEALHYIATCQVDETDLPPALRRLADETIQTATQIMRERHLAELLESKACLSTRYDLAAVEGDDDE